MVHLLVQRYTERDGGWPVTIEYRPDDPATSRIEGMGSAPIPGVFGVLGPIPLAGLAMAGPGLVRGRKARRLLADGKLALGTLKSEVPTDASIDIDDDDVVYVYELTFEFTADDGHAYEVVSKTYKPSVLKDGERKRLLYDAYNPSYAVMLDSLPGSPRIDETGQIRSRWGGIGGLASMVIPLASIIGNGAHALGLFMS